MYSKDDGEVYSGYGSNNSTYPDNNQLYYSSVSRNNTGRISAGMFAGKKTDTSYLLTLSNTSLNGINVHSSRWAGGFFGFGALITLSECPATNISVLGRYDTGGLIGFAANTINILGNTTSKTSISISSVVQDAGGFNFKNSSARNGALGGIIGRYGYSYNDNITGNNVNNVSGKKDKTTLVLSIKNISLNKYGTDGRVAYTFSSYDESCVGGILGCFDNQVKAEITDCTMSGISVVGTQNRVGGVIGGTIADSVITLDKIVLDGSEAVYGIQVDHRDDLGGIVAYQAAGTVNINNTTIKNYTIRKTAQKNIYYNTKDPEGYIGGCIGRMGGGTANLRNFVIDTCSFAGYSRANGCGGLVGTMSGGALVGYNIVENALSTSVHCGSNSSYAADIIGSQDKKEIRIVGFSRHNNTTGVATLVNGTHNTDNTKYYVVCTDFGGDCITNSPNTTASTVNVSGTAMANYSLSPYALINPVDDWVDNQTLTGDGYADTIANLAIDDIIAAKNTNSAYADVTDGTNNTVNTYGNFSTFGGTGKLSTFKTEFPNANNAIPAATYSAIPDFPLLVLDNTNPAQLTKFLNGYLGLLTNTNYNFATNNNKVYTVNNTAYRYVNGSFTAQSSSNLIRNTTTGQFSMSNSSVDNSPNIQFTLLDIQFRDPTSVNNIAYHLYVPVLVKKLMQFDFEAASNSGTLYEPTYYEALINAQYTGATQPINATSNKLLETLKTPVTVYFKYTYRRTLEEWTRALEGGEDLTKGFDKTLTFNVQKNSAATNVIPAGTKYALVDNTRGHKVYYSTASNPPTSGNLSIALTKTGNSFTDESNTEYTPPSFSKLLGITAEKADNGLFVIAGTNETATAEDVNGTKYRLYGSVSTDSSADPQPDRYNLSIDTTNCLKEESSGVYALEESYYLSIFTPSGNNDVYHYTLNKFDNFGDNSFPTKIYNYVGTELYIGDLFEQDFTIVSNESDNEKITAPNGEINADLRTKITVKSEQAHNVFKTVLSNGDVSMFHSFFVSLVRMDEDGTVKGILVKDDDGMTPTVTYSIAGTPMTEVHEVTDNYVSITASGNTGNLATSLGASTAVTDGVTITGTIKLAYTNNISAQFPPKSDPSDTTKGTYFTATSNLSSTKDNIAYSTSTSYDQDVSTIPNDAVHNNHLYYCQQSNVAELNYYAEEQMDNEGGILGQLGVNAWIPNDESEEQVELSFVSTEAKYTVLPIDSRSTAEYVYLTITLQSRQGDYANNLPINEYWSDYKVLSANGTVITPTSYLDPSGNSVSGNSSNVVKLVYLVPRQNMVDGMGASNVFEESAYEIKIPITFWVKTGDNWANNASHYYSNYQVSIHAELRDATDTSKSAETASEKDASLKYTNAKIHWQYFD